MYLARKLQKEMDKHLPPEEFVGKEVSFAKISRAMNKILNPLGARGAVASFVDTENKLRPNYRPFFLFSGFFDTERKTKQIEVKATFGYKKEGTFRFTKRTFNLFRFGFSQTVQHEFIHKSQFMFRPSVLYNKVDVNFVKEKTTRKKREDIEYFSTWCEIEAYAHDIAMEIKQYYPSENPNKILSHIDDYPKLVCYRLYKKAFRGINWDRVRKALLRKTWKWLDTAHAVDLV